MMRSLTHCFLLVSMLICPALVAGQEGIPYITYYDSRSGFESHNWSVCQDTGYSMVFANKQGVTFFDGQNWQSVKLPYVPLEIGTAKGSGDIYVLSDRNYGLLNRSRTGSISYEPLSYEGELDRTLKALHFMDTSVVFYGMSHISFHSLDDQTLQTRLTAGEQAPFSGMLLLNDRIFVNIKNTGLHELKDNSLVQLPNGKATGSVEVLFWLPYDNNRVLVGFDNSTLQLFDGDGFRDYPISEGSYLNDYGLSDGIALNDSLYVLSTYYGGAMIVDRESGKVLTILNYQNGLPDDEVFAIGKDHNGGVWLTYRYGICRVDPLLPVREYSNYPGLEGLLTNTVWYNNTLYVATTEGLFFLEEVKDYSVTEIMVRQQSVARQPVGSGVATLPSPGTATGQSSTDASEKAATLPGERSEDPRVAGEEAAGEKEDKRGFFERIFRRDRRGTEQEQEQLPNEASPRQGNVEEPDIEEVLKEIEVPAASTRQKPRYVRKTVRKLRSVRHVFKKVKGINSGCLHLLPTNSSLLAGSSSGLFAVNDSIAVRLSDSRNISAIHEFDNENFYVVSENGLEILHLLESGWLREKKSDLIGAPLFSVTHDQHFIWVSGYNTVYRLSHDSKLINSYTFESPYPEELHIKYLRDTLFLFTERSVEFYASTLDSFLRYDNNFLPDQYSSLSVVQSTGTYQWLKADNELHLFASNSSPEQQYLAHFGLFKNITALVRDADRGYWIIDSNERLFQLSRSITDHSHGSFKVNIENIRLVSGAYADMSDLTFLPEQAPLQIRLSAPYFPGGEQTRFQYRIEHRMEEWFDWSESPELLLFLEPGENTILVRARNVLGEISQTRSLSITIKTPFYKQPWFYLSLSPILFVLLYIFFSLRERKIKRDKAILEEKVKERTIEISEQKKQIEHQKDAITASITYASRIQRAILPSPALFEAAFGDYFIFFRPRDIVSGDFYWITERDDQVIFTVADCTGHGVPGALMSMLGNSFLNEITKSRKKTLTASGILNQLRVMITNALSQSGASNNTDDGMDIAMCIYNRKTRELNFSGANCPLYLVRDEELHIIKPNRMPIGYFPVKKDFNGHTLKIKKGDIIYLFTDGYSDQFGGKHDKKFTTGRFKKLLLKHADKPMIDQKEYLESAFLSWMDGTIQIDDVLVMGIRF
ncbi:MAG: SpoIIE family protein phosphatase [Bacteroidales bacterium]|nr:SpoIIE family protein phosphatase [Bacteroidales bacterium]MDT8430400.1 SpoIIE family protein phosphatase [Bacteroidales bacterium]